MACSKALGIRSKFVIKGYWNMLDFRLQFCWYMYLLCGCELQGHLTAAEDKGTITSPNYPHQYPFNTDVSWLITGEDNHIITLSFTDVDLEDSVHSFYDYIVVYDGPDATYPEMVKFGGKPMTLPSLYRSSSNSMYIKMTTDDFISGRGFKAEYETEEISSCGGNITTSMPTTISRHYQISNAYHTDCTWLIDVADTGVTSTFTDCDNKETQTCYHDNVALCYGLVATDSENTKLCENSSLYRYHSHITNIRLRTNLRRSGSDIKAEYGTNTSSVQIVMKSGAEIQPYGVAVANLLFFITWLCVHE